MPTAALKVYGLPLSQPSRSVIWLLLERRIPFQLVVTVPGSSGKNGTLNHSFKSRTGLSTMPVLEIENEALCIPESPTILRFLCEKYGWKELNPSVLEQPRVDAYMHWHHSNTRRLTSVIYPYFSSNPAALEKVNMKVCKSVLETIDKVWLTEKSWIGSTSSNWSIADLLAYEEIVQLAMTDLMPNGVSYPNIAVWMERLQSQTQMHDVAHASLQALGLLTPDRIHEMPSILRTANKIGLKAIQEAQDDYYKQSASSKL